MAEEEKKKEDKKDDVSMGDILKFICTFVIIFLVLVVIFKFVVYPAMHRTHLGAGSLLEQSQEEDYWRDRLGI